MGCVISRWEGGSGSREGGIDESEEESNRPVVRAVAQLVEVERVEPDLHRTVEQRGTGKMAGFARDDECLQVFR